MTDEQAAAPADDAPPTGTAGPLTRVNVNLTQRTLTALDNAVHKSGDSRTDTINRAIQVYDLVQDLLRNSDGRSLVIRYPDGETERLHII